VLLEEIVTESAEGEGTERSNVRWPLAPATKLSVLGEKLILAATSTLSVSLV
jgi:hypothetical protein